MPPALGPDQHIGIGIDGDRVGMRQLRPGQPDREQQHDEITGLPGGVHPPVGLNIFVINSLARDVPMMETFKGVIPFLVSDFLRVILLFLFPVVSLYLVRLIF